MRYRTRAQSSIVGTWEEDVRLSVDFSASSRKLKTYLAAMVKLCHYKRNSVSPVSTIKTSADSSPVYYRVTTVDPD